MLNESQIKQKEASIAEEIGVPQMRVCLVGSMRICGAGNDEDYLCLVEKDEVLENAGFEPDLDQHLYDTDFQSWRKGNVNVIAVADPAFYLSEVTVAMSALTLKANDLIGFDMSRREDRVEFHGLVREGVREYREDPS